MGDVPHGFLAEQRKYAIEVREQGQHVPLDWELAVNDQPLERILKAGRDYFRFATEFFAGEIRLTVISKSKIHLDIQLVVEPDRYKLTRSDYASMIADIRRSTLALYRLGKVTLPAPTAASARRTALITIELVRTYFAKFEAAVDKIARMPARLLKNSDKQVNIFDAKRVNDRGLSRALRSKSVRKATQREVGAAPRLVAALKGNWAPDIVQSYRSETVDLYEHRAIVGFMRWLDSVLLNIVRNIDEEPEIDTAQVLRRRVESWRSRLNRLSRHEALRSISPDPCLKATTRFRISPDYASAFSAMSAIRAGLGDGHGLAPAVPIDRTYALYEMWCYIGLLRATTEIAPAARDLVAKLLLGLEDPAHLGIVLATGEVSKIDLNEQTSLTYQRRFTRVPDSEGARTHLLEAVPDVTISARNADGDCRALAIFDPKYRVGPSLLDGLRDLHVYRDAIVGADGQLIRLAVAMTPDARDLAAQPTAIPNDRPVAVTVRPGRDRAIFTALISAGAAI